MTNEQATQNIAANVKRLLMERELTQRELAEMSAEPEMNISRLVNGKNQIGVGTLTRVAEALKVTVDTLISTPQKNSRNSRRTA